MATGDARRWRKYRKMSYVKAPLHWTRNDKNPFTENGLYGPDWSCLCIDADTERLHFCGGGENLLFTFFLGLKSEQLNGKLADFLRYEERHKRKVILSFPESSDVDSFVEEALVSTASEHAVRPEDPKWAVHSTNLEAWEAIRQDGGLKSLAVLRKEEKDVRSVGFEQLGEPPDYAEYVVLGRIDEVNAEHVLASQAKGFVFTDGDAPYQPGVRLYFDNHRIIRDGLAVRDGLHLTKVHHQLPLSPYMAASVSVRDFPNQRWTPRSFWTAANEVFFAKIVGKDP